MKSLLCLVLALPLVLSSGLTAQNEALKQENSNLMLQIEQAIGESEVAGHGRRRRVRTCSRNWFWGLLCCKRCCGGFWAEHEILRGWCNFDKYMCPYNDQNAHLANCDSAESEVGDDMSQYLDSGNQDSENPCNNPVASRCCSTCTTNPDTEECDVFNLDMCPAAAAEKGLTAQNKALKQANSNLMQKIEQAIGESEVAGYGDREVISCGGFWGLFCCEHCCGGVAKHIPGVCNFDKYMCPYNDQQAHLSNCAESEVGNDMSQLFDSGNQDSGNSCDNPIASICCSTCTTNPDPECDLVNFDFNCPAAAAEMESLAFSSVNSFEQGAMLVLASIGLVSSALFVRQCIFSKSKYDQVTDAHAEEI